MTNHNNKNIKIVAIDMDGTLLNSNHTLSATNEQTLGKLKQYGLKILFATGKTRHSAVPVIEKLNIETPGVYVQGLLIVNGDGSIRYQRTLKRPLAEEVAQIAQEMNCSMVAYAGNRIVTNIRDEYTDVFIKYHEPTPEPFGTWRNLFDQTEVNKFIMVSTKERIDKIRPLLETQISGRATIVQALDYMVEILPLGASKGDGVRRVLEDLDIPAAQMLAIGDGENDVEMLRMAGIGVAMGNGMASAKEAADYLTGTNDEDGVTQAIERFIFS